MTTPHRRRGCVDPHRTKQGLRYRAIWDEPRDFESARTLRRQASKCGFVRTRDAESCLNRVLVSIDDGTYVSPRPITLGEFAAGWLGGFRGAATTRDGYQRNLRLHVLPTLGRMRLSRIRPNDLATLYRRLADATAATDARDQYKRAPLGPNTILKIHTLIGTILQAAVDEGVLSSNPARQRRANPPTLREVRAAKPEIHPWTCDEVANFASWASRQEADPLRNAWLLAICTGLRRGEVIGLRWRGVDLEARRLSVRRSRVTVWERGTSRRTIESVPKGAGSRAGTRHVELGDDAVAALRSSDSLPRSQAHARNGVAGGRCASEGRSGATGAFDDRDHDGPVQPRPANDPTGCGGGLRARRRRPPVLRAAASLSRPRWRCPRVRQDGRRRRLAKMRPPHVGWPCAAGGAGEVCRAHAGLPAVNSMDSRAPRPARRAMGRSGTRNVPSRSVPGSPGCGCR